MEYCVEYNIDEFHGKVQVIMVPNEFKEAFLHHHLNLPSAGHLGRLKTLEKLKEVPYWVGMAVKTQEYCKSCNSCMKAKLCHLEYH